MSFFKPRQDQTPALPGSTIENRSEAERCRSKTIHVDQVLIAHDPDPMHANQKWDTYTTTVSLECPKSLLSGQSLSLSEQEIRMHDATTIGSLSQDVIRVAAKSICRGCIYTDMKPSDAFADAADAARARQNLLGELDKQNWPAMTQGLHNEGDLR